MAPLMLYKTEQISCNEEFTALRKKYMFESDLVLSIFRKDFLGLEV